MGPHELLPLLELLPGILAAVVRDLAAADLTRRPAAGGFAVVEQAWHLADLEVEGYGARIVRLLREDDPELPDFDGAAAAQARRYLDLAAAEGASRYQAARAANLARLRALPGRAWARSGHQSGVGRVTLGGIPRMMVEHDRAHAGELSALLAEVAPGHPGLPALQAMATSLSPASTSSSRSPTSP